MEPWWSLGGALVEPWGSLGVALGCLCTPESMPSIWPWGGLGVALGGFARSLAPNSTFCFLLSGLARVWLSPAPNRAPARSGFAGCFAEEPSPSAAWLNSLTRVTISFARNANPCYKGSLWLALQPVFGRSGSSATPRSSACRKHSPRQSCAMRTILTQRQIGRASCRERV